jgi:hypothetical protein
MLSRLRGTVDNIPVTPRGEFNPMRRRVDMAQVAIPHQPVLRQHFENILAFLWRQMRERDRLFPETSLDIRAIRQRGRLSC